jgi:hypothetical protein
MAEKIGIALTSIEGFPADASAGLGQLWITTAEELVAAADLPDGKRGLADHLGISEQATAALVAAAREALPVAARSYAMDEEEYPTGALDEREELPAGRQVDFGVEELPAKVDYHDRLPPPRHQGERGSCVAFSSVAAREYLLGGQSTAADLSEQYLYWACKDRDNYPGQGTWVKVATAVLEEAGVCTEEIWRYNPISVPGNEGQGPPPEDAARLAQGYRIGGWTRLDPQSTYELRAPLVGEQLVVFTVPVYSYWSQQPVRFSGDVRLPLTTDLNPGGHAMCIVGYEDDPSVPGGGYFIIRNSWGEDWGQGSKVAPGYGRLPYRYLEAYGTSAYTFWAR